MKSNIDGRYSIEVPLLAFERVYRGTGRIRKTCIFRNPGEEAVDLQVRYGFKEHSWLGVFHAEPRPEAAVEDDTVRPPGSISLHPGETRVHVVMNTDNANFPYDRFRGRVYFDEPEGTAGGRWLEISFEEIEELRDFEGFAAIDLGTSNSMLSLYHLRRDAVTGMPWSPVLDDERGEIPSAVFVKDLSKLRTLTEGACTVGVQAILDYQDALTHDPRTLQIGTKRLIGAGRVLVADEQGAGGYVDPLNVLYMLGRHIRESAQNHDDIRARLRRLIVTFPPTWDYRQINRWKEVFARLGFSEDELDLSLDEASAAGLFYVHEWTKDADARNRLIQDLLPSWQEVHEGSQRGDRYTLNLLSFDFGGGTIDLALIEVHLTLMEDIIRLRIALKGSDSMNYGGDQVTLSIFKILKRRLAMVFADPERWIHGNDDGQEDRKQEDNSGLFLLPGQELYRRGSGRNRDERARQQIIEAWDDLQTRPPAESLSSELEDAIDLLFPTRFWRSDEEPLSARAKRNFGWLWDRAEQLKRQLFREASRRLEGVSLVDDEVEEIEGGIPLADIPEEIVQGELRGTALTEGRVSVRIGEVYQAIRGPLENAVLRGRKLTGGSRVDRVVLTGQSSWIPLVRRLFMQAKSEGGFGLPPNKIEFDEENAKAAVSKGACLLRVMRDTMVGFEVDVSDFKANLLADIFYKNPLGERRVLFGAGPIDDFGYFEDDPDPTSFAQHLAIFYGAPENILGQFDFSTPGAPLDDFSGLARELATSLGLESLPTPKELARIRTRDNATYQRISSGLLDWPQRSLIAWIEQDASASSDRPVYRYYMSRNRNLVAVRDRGGEKRLFSMVLDERFDSYASARENPFSGVH